MMVNKCAANGKMAKSDSCTIYLRTLQETLIEVKEYEEVGTFSK